MDGQPELLFQQKSRPDSALERKLSAFLKPLVHVGKTSTSAYNFFGVSGILLAVLITISLTVLKGESLWISVALLLLAGVASVLNIVITTLVTGRDSLVYLRYFVSIMAASAILLRILEVPVLSYLENLMLGLGTLQGVGRIGCLKTGCCYGKPASFGVRYPSGYAGSGFPRSLIGIRLFPVQALESAWIFISAAISIFIALTSAFPGSGLATHIILFGTGRVVFELLRGDTARPYWGPFSEAQWICTALVAGTLLLEMNGTLQLFPWHVAIGAGLGLGLIVIAYRHYTDPLFTLSQPANIHQLANSMYIFQQADQQQIAGSHAVHLRHINNLKLSRGVSKGSKPEIQHYAYTRNDSEISHKEAIRWAQLINNWNSPSIDAKLINYNNTVFYLLLFPRSSSPRI